MITKSSSFVVDSAMFIIVLLFAPFNSFDLKATSIATISEFRITYDLILAYNFVVVCPSFINLG